MTKRKPRVTVYVNQTMQDQLERAFRYLQSRGVFTAHATLNEHRAQVIGWCVEQAMKAIPPRN
jgi:hypothetical protein